MPSQWQVLRLTRSFLMMYFPHQPDVVMASAYAAYALLFIGLCQIAALARTPVSSDVLFAVPCMDIPAGTRLPSEFAATTKFQPAVSHFLGAHLGLPGCVMCHPDPGTLRPRCVANPVVHRRRGRERTRSAKVGHTCAHALTFSMFEAVDVSYEEVDSDGILGKRVNETLYTDSRGILFQFSLFVLAGNASCTEWVHPDRARLLASPGYPILANEL